MWLQNCTIAEARPVRICELLRTSAFLTPFFDVAPLWHAHSGHNIILVLNTLRRGPPAAARTLQLVLYTNAHWPRDLILMTVPARLPTAVGKLVVNF